MFHPLTTAFDNGSIADIHFPPPTEDPLTRDEAYGYALNKHGEHQDDKCINLVLASLFS